MTNFKRQIFSVLAAGSMLVSSSVPAFASTTIELSGNGSNSYNTANVTTSSNTTVTQSNVASINNNVDVCSVSTHQNSTH